MTAGREYFALDWLKDELDETLKVARQALESYSESGRDATRMRSCLTALHQVHGTLLMLELTGVTVLSDELEQLAQAMHDGTVVDLEAAQQLLMQGILQLPAHLEEIQKGLPDTRRVVLVLANDIRLARGEEGFSDAARLTQNELLLPADDEVLDRFDEIDGADKARKIRGAFQQVLLSLLKGRGRDDAAAVLSKVAIGLERICEGAPIVVLWQALGAYLGSVAATGEALSGDVVKVLRRVDAEIKNLATIGREALAQPVNAVLVGVLLDAATRRGAENIELRQIADTLALEAGSQTAAISGREAMQHAAGALREDLAAIKDELDMFVRSDERTADGFKQLATPLRQIGSTLSILGFESSREILADQMSALDAALETGDVDDAVLMGIAGALIQVDENLAALGRSRRSTLAGTSEAAAIISDAQIAVLNEARNGLEETKHAVVDYIAAQWDVSRLEAIPDLLGAVKGALAIVPLAMPAVLLGQCVDYVRDHLLCGEKPDWQALDHFADAISGVDYFLERLIAEGAPPGDEILVVVQRSLAALGVAGLDPDEVTAEPVLMEAVAEPVEAADESVGDVSADDVSASPDSEFSLELLDESKPESAPEQEGGERVEVADVAQDVEHAQADAPVAAAGPLERSFEAMDEQSVGDEDAGVVAVEAPLEQRGPLAPKVEEPTDISDEEFDEEIVEIFAEEVTEVLKAVDDWLPQWADGFANEEALTETRRAFHTLKGSGRLVGAQLIGKLAWSIENLLNRIMDGTVEPHVQVVSLIREALRLIPSLSEGFRARQPVEGEAVAAIVGRADVLSSGGRIEELGAPVEILDEAAVESDFESGPDAQAQQMSADGASQEPDLDEPEIGALQTAAVDESEALAGGAKDPEVMALFEEEANRHLEILESRFNSEDDIAELELDEAVMRALHTLRGSAAMARIDAVAGIATPLYDVATAFRETMRPITPDLFDFLQQGVFALRRSLDALGVGHEPDEDQALFESEARRILVELSANPASGATSLLQLEGTAVLLGAGDQLNDWRERGVESDGLVDVVAALHEVRNECQSRGLDGVADLCDGLIESYQRFESVPLSAAAFESLDEGHELLLEVFDRIAADQEPPEMTAAVGKLAAARLEEPESIPASAGDVAAETGLDSAELFEFPTVEPAAEQQNVARRTPRLPDDVDEEILEIFFEEADELLESIDHGVHEWFEARDNRVYLENLLRALHTLKGGARLAGLLELGDETHALESYLVAVQNEEADPDDAFFSDLQRRHDELATTVLLLKAAAHGEEIDPESASVGMDASVASQPLDDDPAETDAEPDVATAEEPIVPVEPAQMQTADVVPLAQITEVETETEPQAPTSARASEPREMVRVGATLLEELVNLAGENSIIRSRIEQVINDFSGSLEEMETTIERVREQLRRLEIETETQVLFRHARGDGPDYDEFDPLEMDRYSQLQQVSKSLSETASDMLDLKETLGNKARESETLLIQQARVNTELQEGLMRTRMVPFSRLLPRLRRIVRQVARDLGKQVEFHAYNAEGELDRNVLDRIVPALEHMLRNSVDHGIEMPGLRSKVGKPELGRIDLRLSREGGDVVIEITDDGAGIDIETVRAKAIERGLMSADAWMADDDILQFVLAPGFSTAKAVTQISGRGVGMDVVHSAVKQLGGGIDIVSMPGKGTRFTVRLPFTVFVSRALMVSVGDDMYAVPLNNIEGIVRVSTRELAELSDPEGMGFEYAGVPYRVRYLGSYIGREYAPRPVHASVPMVLIRSGDQALAVHVDSVQGSREIVVKSLGPQFAGVGGISGATILGDGRVVVILDLISLIRAHGGASAQVRSERPQYTRDPAQPKCVMVVDDSVTVRKVTSRLLERQGMDVIVAKDGVEAIALMQERRPDIILLDIEMPRMDGFEVARQVRHDQGLAELPIVMISSRTGSKHQERAAELGVNRFLGKPFQESDLLATIDELVGK